MCLSDTIEAAIRQHQVQSAERTLLSRTLTGTIGLVTEVLSVVNPTAYGRSNRLRQLAHQLCANLGIEDAWQIEVAAMLSQVGCVAVPESLLAKQLAGSEMSQAEIQTLHSQAILGSKLVAKIPRLESVARMIAHTAGVHNSRHGPEWTSMTQFPRADQDIGGGADPRHAERIRHSLPTDVDERGLQRLLTDFQL